MGAALVWGVDDTSVCGAEIAKEVQALNSLMHLWDSVLPRRVLRVRYEELVRDQEGVSRKILAHCGVPWDPAVLEFHRNERRVSTASTAQVGQGVLQCKSAWVHSVGWCLRGARSADLVLHDTGMSALTAGTRVLGSLGSTLSRWVMVHQGMLALTAGTRVLGSLHADSICGMLC